MTRTLLAALILILLAATPTTAHTVEGGWQRSDDAPEATPTAPPPEEMPAPTAAPPETATAPEEPEAAGTAWLLYGAVGACGLFALIMLWRWLQGDA